MKASTATRNHPKHVVQWVREQLEMTQLQFSEATKVGLFSLQSIESGRLKLSERFAYRLNKATDIQPEWFLANKLVAPLPDRAKLKKHFEFAQKAAVDLYPARVAPWMFIYRFAHLQIALAKKHRGLAGFRHSGLQDRMGKMNMELLATIKNPKERRKFYEKTVREMKGKDEQVLLSHIARCRDLLRFIRKNKAQQSDEPKVVVQQSVKGSNRKR
jgi:transcriptional regulator with XRE-family HTH domain